MPLAIWILFAFALLKWLWGTFTAPDSRCPACGSLDVTTDYQEDSFNYGPGPVKLTCIIPFRTCSTCKFEYTDSEAEEARSKAIKRYLTGR